MNAQAVGLAKDIVARVESADDPAAGIESALAFVEQNRAEIHRTQGRVWASTATANKGLQDRILSSSIGNAATVNGLQFRLLKHTRDSPRLQARLDALIDAYTKLVTQ